MAKVVGSSPIIRSRRPRSAGPFAFPGGTAGRQPVTGSTSGLTGRTSDAARLTVTVRLVVTALPPVGVNAARSATRTDCVASTARVVALNRQTSVCVPARRTVARALHATRAARVVYVPRTEIRPAPLVRTRTRMPLADAFVEATRTVAAAFDADADDPAAAGDAGDGTGST